MRRQSIPPAPKPCVVCGAVFERRPSEPWRNFNNRLTCSGRCKGERIKRTRYALGIDPPRIELICETCGKKFYCRPSAQLSATGSIKRFCSRECQGVARRRVDWSYPTPAQTIVACRVCGREKISWTNYGRKYCDYLCAALGRTRDRELAHPTRPEMAVRAALETLGDSFEQQRIIYPYVVDFFLPERNAIIECLGDYFHCNPEKYPHGPVDDRQREWIEKDRQRFPALERMGFRLITIWASEIKNSDPVALLRERLG